MIDPARAFQRIEEQHALGPRWAGAPGHAKAQGLLADWLRIADTYREHCFEQRFFGEPVACRNLWGRFEGEMPGRLLLGSHFDTRPWADHDPDPKHHRHPVPGANDGGSGVALLAELAPELLRRRQRPTVDLVFFDAEDWHEIDGKEVSLGARRFVSHLQPEDTPDRVIILDMIGGKDLMLDVDVNCQQHHPSYAFTLELFQLGRSLGLPAFAMNKLHPYKWIVCDHMPFMLAGIASALLIDIDYPPWHTVADLPEHCDPDSLAQMARLLDSYLFAGAPDSRAPGPRGPNRGPNKGKWG